MKKLLALLFTTAAIAFAGLSVANAAVVERVNSEGTLLKLQPTEGETFVDGEQLFIILESKMRGVGTLKVEASNEILLRMPASNFFKVGDRIELSHQKAWAGQSDADKPVVGFVKQVADTRILFQIEERFLPVFWPGQKVEIQRDEDLKLIPAVVKSYKKTGLVLKVQNGTELPNEGVKGSLIPKDIETRYKEVPQISKAPSPLQLAFRLGFESLSFPNSKKPYLGPMIQPDLSKNLRVAPYWSVPLGIGLQHEVITNKEEGIKFTLTSQSLVFHSGYEFSKSESNRFGLEIAYEYGLNAEVVGELDSVREKLKLEKSTLNVGISGAYSLNETSQIGGGAALMFGDVRIKSGTSSESQTFTGVHTYFSYIYLLK